MNQPVQPQVQQSTKDAFSLSDAVSLYQKQIDLVHKFWNYLWLVGSLTVTAVGLSAGSPTLGQKLLWLPLLAGFVAFAVGNLILMLLAQCEARMTADSIRAYLDQPACPPVFDKFRSVLKSFSPWPGYVVAIGHLLFDAFVIACLLSLVGKAPWPWPVL